MGEIVRRIVLGPREREPLLGVPREVQRAIEVESAKGLVRGAQVQGDAYEAHLRFQAAADLAGYSLDRLAALSEEEGRYIRQTPLGEERYRHIIDGVAGVAAYQVNKVGYGR